MRDHWRRLRAAERVSKSMFGSVVRKVLVVIVVVQGKVIVCLPLSLHSAGYSWRSTRSICRGRKDCIPEKSVMYLYHMSSGSATNAITRISTSSMCVSSAAPSVTSAKKGREKGRAL